MRVACIGTREPGPEGSEICRKLGRFIVELGGIVVSGNATGCDQAYARGGNEVDPTRVHLYTPWPGYNAEALVSGNHVHSVQNLSREEFEFYQKIAADLHPAWGRCTQGAQKLHMRNGCILLPPPEISPVDYCIAYPSNSRGGGGTGQGMRIAESKDIPLANISQFSREQLQNLCHRLMALAG